MIFNNRATSKKYYMDKFIYADNILKKINTTSYSKLPIVKGETGEIENLRLDPKTLEFYVLWEDGEVTNLPIFSKKLNKIRNVQINKYIDGGIIIAKKETSVQYLKRRLHLIYFTLCENPTRGSTYVFKDLNVDKIPENLIEIPNNKIQNHYNIHNTTSVFSLPEDIIYDIFELAIEGNSKSVIRKILSEQGTFLSDHSIYRLIYPLHHEFNEVGKFYLSRFLDKKNITLNEYLRLCKFNPTKKRIINDDIIARRSVRLSAIDKGSMSLYIEGIKEWIDNYSPGYGLYGKLINRHEKLKTSEPSVKEIYLTKIRELIDSNPQQYMNASLLLYETTEDLFYHIHPHTLRALIEVYRDNKTIKEVCEKYNIENVSNFSNFVLPTKARRNSIKRKNVFKILTFLMQRFNLKIKWSYIMLKSLEKECPEEYQIVRDILRPEIVDLIIERKYVAGFNYQLNKSTLNTKGMRRGIDLFSEEVKNNDIDELSIDDMVIRLFNLDPIYLFRVPFYYSIVEKIYNSPEILNKVREGLAKGDKDFLFNVFRYDIDTFNLMRNLDVATMRHLDVEKDRIYHKFPRGIMDDMKYERYYNGKYKSYKTTLKYTLIYQILTGYKFYSKEELIFIKESIYVKKKTTRDENLISLFDKALSIIAH